MNLGWIVIGLIALPVIVTGVSEYTTKQCKMEYAQSNKTADEINKICRQEQKMTQVNATVTIRLVYDTDDLQTTDKASLVKEHLTDMVNELAGDGKLSGYHDMTIDNWDCEVSAIEIN